MQPVVAARSISATGRSQRTASPASSTRGSGVRTPGSRPPRLEPHEHAVGRDEPLVVHDRRGPPSRGRRGAARRAAAGAGRPRRCPRAARRRAARRPSPSWACAPPGGVPLELLEHRDVVERPVAARAEERRALRRDLPGQPQPPDRERRTPTGCRPRDSRHAAPASPSPPRPGEAATTRRRPTGSSASTTASASSQSCSSWPATPCSTERPSPSSATERTSRPVTTVTPRPCQVGARAGAHSVES